MNLIEKRKMMDEIEEKQDIFEEVGKELGNSKK